jgi:hypothetical protein
MMKLFAYILSVYVVILTVMPCIDEYQDTISQKVELTTNSTNTQHNDTDHCSPFCTCTCCASPVVFMNNEMQIESFPVTQEHQFEYKSSYRSSEHFGIWQPPKIS